MVTASWSRSSVLSYGAFGARNGICTATADVRNSCGAEKDKAIQNGATPMVIASQNRLSVVVQLLCGAGAEKDKAEQNGATPIIIASHNGHSEVVQLLCGAGAE